MPGPPGCICCQVRRVLTMLVTRTARHSAAGPCMHAHQDLARSYHQVLAGHTRHSAGLAGPCMHITAAAGHATGLAGHAWPCRSCCWPCWSPWPCMHQDLARSCSGPGHAAGLACIPPGPCQVMLPLRVHACISGHAARLPLLALHAAHCWLHLLALQVKKLALTGHVAGLAMAMTAPKLVIACCHLLVMLLVAWSLLALLVTAAGLAGHSGLSDVALLVMLWPCRSCCWINMCHAAPPCGHAMLALQWSCCWPNWSCCPC